MSRSQVSPLTDDPYLTTQFWNYQLKDYNKQVTPAAASCLSFLLRLMVSDLLNCLVHVKRLQAEKQMKEKQLTSPSQIDRQALTITGNPLYLMCCADVCLVINWDEDLNILLNRFVMPDYHSRMKDHETEESEQTSTASSEKSSRMSDESKQTEDRLNQLFSI